MEFTFFTGDHALLCSAFVTRTALLNTPVVLATAEQCLHNIKAFLLVTLGVGKDLGGNRGGTADTDWLKRYSILCIFMLRDENLGVGDGTSSSTAIAQNLEGHRSDHERWWVQHFPLPSFLHFWTVFTLTRAFSCFCSSRCVPTPPQEAGASSCTGA